MSTADAVTHQFHTPCGAGYDVERDGPLPTLLYAYPREYKNKEAAGQLRKSPCTFPGERSCT